MFHQIQIVPEKVEKIIKNGIFYVSLTAFQSETEAKAYLLQLSNLESDIKEVLNKRREKVNKKYSDLRILNFFKELPVFGEVLFEFRKHLYLYLELEKEKPLIHRSSEDFRAQERHRLNLKKTFDFADTDIGQRMDEWVQGRRNLVFLIMAANVKMLLEKMYPLLKEEVNTKESFLNIIDMTFFIQNSRRNMNQVILKSNIENLILEQEYGVLVLPSNVYSDETSRKKLKDFYNHFFEENPIEQFKSFLEEKVILELKRHPSKNTLEYLLENTVPCLISLDSELKNYNSKHQNKNDFPHCTSEKILPNTLKDYKNFAQGLLMEKEDTDSDRIYKRRAYTRILPWTIILEWICSKVFEYEPYVPIHFRRESFQRINWAILAYDHKIQQEKNPDSATRNTAQVMEPTNSNSLSSHSTKKNEIVSDIIDDPQSSVLILKNYNLDLLSINQIQIVPQNVGEILKDGVFYVALAAFQSEDKAKEYLLQLFNLEFTITQEFRKFRGISNEKNSDIEILGFFPDIYEFGAVMFDFRKHLYLHLELEMEKNLILGSSDKFREQERHRFNLKKAFNFKETSVNKGKPFWVKARKALVFLMMAANVKILLEKTYPVLKEKGNIDEFTSNLINNTFFIQNSRRNINQVILKSNIENLILEQEYDVLVLPSNVYSDKTSMQKLKDFYNHFFEENQMERFKSFFEKNIRDDLGQPNEYIKFLENAGP
ncbi:hypothetical protein HMI55_002649, partial [Coelomomyces lativittatus]